MPAGTLTFLFTMDAFEPNDLLQILQNDLEPWVKLRKGAFSLAGDPGDVLEQLAEAPASFRVVAAWEGDEDQTGEPEAGIVDNAFSIWVIKAKGLRLQAGAHLVKASTAGDPPFLRLLSDVRARVRSLAFPEGVTYGRLLYKGSKPFPSPELAYELPTVGFTLRFTLTSSIPFAELRG